MEQAQVTHESRQQVVEYRLQITQANGKSAYYYLQREDMDTDETDEHIVGSADFTINYALNKLTYQDALMAFQPYSSVELQTIAKGHVTLTGYPGATTTGWRTIFFGIIRRQNFGDRACELHVTDPLGGLERCAYDVGVFEADTARITGSTTPPSTAPDDAADGTFIYMKEIVEGGESRWIVPGNGNDNGAGAHPGPYYADAFTGGAADADEANRRQWKFIGRVWVEDMDLDNPPTDYGMDIQYNDPLPRNFYDIGGDTGDYLEFKDGYTPPAGKKVYIELVLCYVEGTNQIEDIFLSAVNPRFPTRITGSTAVNEVVCARSRFVRDGIMVGGKIKKKGDPDGSALTILSVDDQQTLTLSAAHGWSVDDELELFDCCELAPRWQDGTHFNTTGNYGGLNPRTIWPSLITVNRFQWLVSDGSLLKMLEDLLDYCPPNYRPFWDHEHNMMRWQYVEITPFESTTPYYQQGSYPYGAFDVTGVFAPPEVGEDAYWPCRVKKSINVARDDETFSSIIVCQGTNERPKNLVDDEEVKLISWPPGNTVSDFQHSAGILSGNWNPIEALGSHYSSGNYYAKWHGASGNRSLPVRDINVDTILAFENPAEIGEGTLFAPIYCIDLGQPTRVGRIVLWGGNSWRDFTWGLRVECCDENGLTWDAVNSQWYPNTGAAWQIMHPDYYAARLKPYERKEIAGGWNNNYTRYILISMSHAKVQLEDWCYVGLSEIQVFAEDVVYGQARIEGQGFIVQGFPEIVDWNDPVGGLASVDITDNDVNFVTAGVVVGNTVMDVYRGVEGTVTAINVGGNPNKISVDFVYAATPAPEGRVWAGDHIIVLDHTAPAVGSWRGFAGTDENDAVWLTNMPVLYNQLVTPGSGFAFGHQHAEYEDSSLSTSDMCALRAGQILMETLRDRLSGDFEINWHNDLKMYHTVELYDRRTGIQFKGLVKGVSRKKGTLTVTIEVYFPHSWTKELIGDVTLAA